MFLSLSRIIFVNIYVNLIFPSSAAAISIIGVFGNIFLITVIISDKKIQTPCFALIAGSAVGSLIMACGYLLSTLSRLGALPITNQQRITCQFLTGLILKTVSIPYNSQAAFLISLDRLFCTVRPIAYRQLGKRYAAIGISICAIYGIVELFVLIQRFRIQR